MTVATRTEAVTAPFDAVTIGEYVYLNQAMIAHSNLQNLDGKTLGLDVIVHRGATQV